MKVEFLKVILVFDSEKIAPPMFALLPSNTQLSSVRLLLFTISAPPTVEVVLSEDNGWGLTFPRSKPAVFDVKKVAVMLTVLFVINIEVFSLFCPLNIECWMVS